MPFVYFFFFVCVGRSDALTRGTSKEQKQKKKKKEGDKNVKVDTQKRRCHLPLQQRSRCQTQLPRER